MSMHNEHDEHDGHDGEHTGAGIWLDRVNEAYYDRLGEGMGRKTRDRINWMCAQCEGSTVLDVGCSQGITSLLLGREGFDVHGIDIMAEAVEYASRELAVESPEVRGRVRFERMDLLSMASGRVYDNVVMGEVVEHQTSAPRFLKAARKHVAPGGRLVVTVPFGLHPFPDHKCTVFPRDIAQALEGMRFDHIDVVDGYIRVVATADVGSTQGQLEPERLLLTTESGTLAAQELRFEALAAARRNDAARKELAAKLAKARDEARASAAESAKLMARDRQELSQLKSQLLATRNEALSASAEIERISAALRDADRDRERGEAARREAAEVSTQLQSALAKAERDLAGAIAAKDAALEASADLEEKLAGIESELVELDQSRRRLRELRGEVRRLERERDAQRQRHEVKVERMVDYRRRLEHQHATVKGWLDEANAELDFLKSSVSFQLGMTLMAATRSVRDFVALPIRLGRLAANGVRRRRERRKHPAVSASAGAKEEDPSLAFASPAPAKPGKTPQPKVADVSSLAPVALPSGRIRVLPLLDAEPEPAVVTGAFPSRVSELRVAAIMDDFTRESFRHCCTLMQLTPDGWREEMEAFAPHIVLVESAWKGEGERWARKIYPLSDELRDLVTAARAAGIPTAFWNKEDPVHFSVFLPTARLFDHVFTTDIDCMKGYRAELGHDRVSLLPFACEPRSHNPVETHDRVDGFCFAGSYYAKYPERQRDFASIVDALAERTSVDIFDRNLGKGDASLEFPDRYAGLIRGNLPYDQIDRAYKGYRYGININTVKQSQSMFARRAFDLLASNTVTVSNYSRGLRLMFGDLVVSSDSGSQVMERLRPYLQDETAYRKFRLLGLRKVLSEHTYEDRMAFVASRVAGRAIDVRLPAVRVLARVSDAQELDAVVAAFDRQRYRDRSLAIIAAEGVGTGRVDGRADILVASPDRMTGPIDTLADGADHVAVFSPGDYYGPSYLTDLALATRYSDADVIGKRAHYAAGTTGGPSLLEAGTQYARCDGIPPGRSIVRVSALAGRSVADVLDGCSGTLSALAIDEFNYCSGHAADACPAADDLVVDPGIALDRLQEMAAASGERDQRAGQEPVLIGYGATQLASLFPEGEYAAGKIRLATGESGIEVASTLGAGKFAYVYANACVPVEVLFPNDIGRFNMLASAGMLVSITLIFLDGNQQRIGHVIRACNSNQSVVPPEGTRLVMLGFRFQDAGLATLDRLVLQHMPPDVDAIASTGRHLLVSRSYPSYEQLYSYTFVHRRVAGYRAAGLGVDVFRFSDAPLSYSEFEGVDVVGGNVGDLALMLESNGYASILVHSFDEQVWSAVEPWLGRSRVVVWVHGAEIQPWYRRDFNNANDAERRAAIHRSDMRMALWRRVLGELPDGLHLVFVSEHLANEAMRDLGIVIPRDRYTVIHNHVDGELFPYREKDALQRQRILSIRPYSKRTYANDLAVRAVLDLAREPWFQDLRFSFFGDGPLFDETLAPLREGFPNIHIERRFLTQQEIREAHAAHGVFLVPSRIDSQGVSRDEAMASGLVPVTNRVSAIPEFVDEHAGFLADAEDWRGLADAIRQLQADPDRYLRMSRQAAEHVRTLSGRQQTLDREIDLILGRPAPPGDAVPGTAAPRRIAVYGDLNLNLLDGSAVWAASLVEVLSGLDDVQVDLFLKAKLSNTRVVASLLGLTNVRLIEPGAVGDVPDYRPEEALARIAVEDEKAPYRAIVLRGFAVNRLAARTPQFEGRLWAYLTDVPQNETALDESWRIELGRIAEASQYLLCQTQPLQDLLDRCVPQAQGRTRRLPPMIPDRRRVARVVRDGGDGVLRIAYAGKFAPLWGIREMFETFERLHAQGVASELHVFGDKIHNPPDDPDFKPETLNRLRGMPGVVWHGGVSRAELYEALSGMDVGWAWRRPELEQGTLELSTKVLEYGQCGLPCVMLPSGPNLDAFGGNYPLFAADVPALVAVLGDLAARRELRDQASTLSARVAQAHGFDHIRRTWVVPLLAHGPDAPPRG
ncbi:glycosyltransferase [Luteimonas sp. M1R5S18]|uniref:Glycosyltransferase n=1 Tax=Luteimonas rhizosphaericola TaxID=3042024 RepID=A0ABT6JMZ0_9GAMM|nr:glycosyltransferase [Luteimonas rhizosphaericola]MDH5831823.1 glycosyltransferase [Luteimonas rhizosphaericola]